MYKQFIHFFCDKGNNNMGVKFIIYQRYLTQMLWQLATNKCGILRPQIASLRMIKCCGLCPQQIRMPIMGIWCTSGEVMEVFRNYFNSLCYNY